MIVTSRALDGHAAERVQSARHHVIPIKIACDFAIKFGFRHFHMSDKVPWSGGDEPEPQNAVWIDQNALATAEQSQASPFYHLSKPRLKRIDTSVIDRFVPYFDIAIGLCLLLGFFTPVAALAAAGFLGSVFLSQFPPTTGPGSSNYQLIECMACLVLAATGSGRLAGLDYFLHLIVRKIWGGQAPQS